MGFFARARAAGAEEYGRRRAEAYGRTAQFLRLLGLLAIVALVIGIGYAAHGGLGG
jgi:predicted lysophospholipase L1 biosynthesis ABC-type transport system permease subunit